MMSRKDVVLRGNEEIIFSRVRSERFMVLGVWYQRFRMQIKTTLNMKWHTAYRKVRRGRKIEIIEITHIPVDPLTLKLNRELDN